MNRKSAGELLVAAAVVLAVALVATLVVVLGRGDKPLPSTISSPTPSPRGVLNRESTLC